MTIWSPQLGSSGPRYRSIAECLARDIARGRLAPGTRLPTHRALATQIGVTVGTITRAYREVERLGLVSGEVGRGTFVREPPLSDPTFPELARTPPGTLDLARNVPDARPAVEPLRRALRSLARRRELASLLDYQPPAGAEPHREAGARWLARAGLEVERDQIVVTAGAQHALAVTLASLTQPGDLVLAAELSYPGLTSVARLLRLRLQGVALDASGIRPASIEAACAAREARALYCVPTVQNPTAAVMPAQRRREVAAVAARHGVAIVEDDIWGFLPRSAPVPLASHAPDSSYYFTSLSKSVAPGLRVGFLGVPRSSLERVAAALRSTVWMAPPLTAEIASLWIGDGTAARLAGAQRREARARVALARRVLARLDVEAPRESYHVWLRLPEPWRAAEFCAQARARGVAVLPAEAFAVGRSSAPQAVRICIGAAPSRDELERGLRVLADLARAAPSSAETPL